MKKILIISSFPAPYRVAVFRGLAAHYDIDVFFEFVKDQSRSDQWFEREKAFHILTDPGEMETYRKCLRHLKEYDLVLAYDYNNRNARNLMLRCIAKGVPYCINCDGAFINRNWLKDRVKRLFISHARACFASGRFARDYFLAYGAKPENIYFHRFTSLTEKDLQTAPAAAKEKEDMRRELGLPLDKKIVLSIGQFIYRKGYDILFDAWKKAEEDNADLLSSACLVVLGGGEKQKEYEEQLRRLSLTNVSLLGYRSKEDVLKFYRASDIFVLPTREDIWGLVVNEAMAQGLPVIATDRCIAAVELITEGENGLLVASENPKQLAEALRRLLADENLRLFMGENNIKKMSDCTIKQIVKCHTEVIDQL